MNRVGSAVQRYIQTLKPQELNDIVDMSDVQFEHDFNFMLAWRVQVSEAVIDNSKDGKQWALDFIVKAERF